MNTEISLLCNKNTQTFLQIFGHVAFIKQKENDHDDNVCKINVDIYNALAIIIQFDMESPINV